jgi:hypothetical protein
MNKFLLAGAVVLFGGVAATGAIAADHKGSKPAAPHHAALITPMKPSAHKESTPRHQGAKHKTAHKAHKAHTK